MLFGVITLLALASLVLPFALRTSRLMWVVIVCGGALALVSSRVAITVDADGVVTIKLYSLDDVYLKESSAGEWWLRKDEFIDVVEPYIDSRIEEL